MNISWSETTWSVSHHHTVKQNGKRIERTKVYPFTEVYLTIGGHTFIEANELYAKERCEKDHILSQQELLADLCVISSS